VIGLAEALSRLAATAETDPPAKTEYQRAADAHARAVKSLHEAVFPAQRQVPVPRTDDFEADLRAVIRRMFESYSRPEARAALPGLIADLHGDVALRSSVIDRLEAQARADFAEMIERAQHDGAFASEIDADLVLDTVVGAMFHRVVARAVTEEAFVDELAQLLLNGMRPGKARAAARKRNGKNSK